MFPVGQFLCKEILYSFLPLGKMGVDPFIKYVYDHYCIACGMVLRHLCSREQVCVLNMNRNVQNKG